MPTALYVHVESLNRLPGVLRVYEGCARVLTGDVEGTTILKLRRHEPKVSYLVYPSFATDAHPALVRSLRVDLRSFHLKDRNFRESTDRPILHRKEEFVPEDSDRELFAALTRAAGLYASPERIGNRQGWLTVCRLRRVRIVGRAVVTDDRPPV
jgi:DNA phosphorothioation-associated putative methyltransferase